MNNLFDPDRYRLRGQANPLPTLYSKVVKEKSCVTSGNPRKTRSAQTPGENPAPPPYHDRDDPQPYLSGSIPLAWFRKANEAGGSALAVGIALWYEAGRRKTKRATVTVTQGLCDLLGVKEDSRRRALQALQRAGLIRLDQQGRGMALTATLLPCPSEDEPDIE